jgi:hypothetical protein
MAKTKNFLKGLKKGALTAAAKRKNMTISQYCSQSGLSSLAKKRCNFAKVAKTWKHK